jgi:hypothetical protein
LGRHTRRGAQLVHHVGVGAQGHLRTMAKLLGQLGD